jgi:hypothetical protein
MLKKQNKINKFNIVVFNYIRAVSVIFYMLVQIVLWRPKNFGRHFLDIQVKCKLTFRNRNPTFDSCHFDNQFKLFKAQIFQKSDMNK